MRTLAEILRQQLGGENIEKKEKRDERRYSVEGNIVFEFTPAFGRECPEHLAKELRDAIVQADKTYSWRDKSDYDDSEAPSIGYLGGVETQYHNIAVPQLHIWFHIKPGIGQVRKSQVYAYEKYLENLAEVLAGWIGGATSVRSVFRVCSVKFFKQ